jgi:hypothetical protein
MSIMRLRSLVLVLAGAAAVVPAQAAVHEQGAPLVRMRDGHGSDLLFRLDARTLQQVGRPIRTFRGGSALAFSPDGSKIAYADPFRGRSRIHIVDLARWRSRGIVRLPQTSWLEVGWASDNRIVALADTRSGRRRLVWIAAGTKRVIARRTVSGVTMKALPVPGGFALALGPHEGVGALRILLLEPDGAVRTIVVDRIKAGATYDDRRGEILTPGITVDPDGGRMYVVSARGLLVAEVDLASGAVSYHPLGASASKGNSHVWWRDAVWAGDGRIALTGDHWLPVRGHGPSNGPVPLGIRMIDTSDWSIATLDPRPDTMHVAGDTVLAAGTRWFDAGRRSKSTGLLAFDASGRRAFTRFRGEQVVLLGSRGNRGYVWVRKARTAHVIDLRSGRTLHTIRTGRRVPFLLSPGG